MKILHTTDWHAGKTLRGARRVDELDAVLKNLAEYVREEGVDLVLITGDIFDSGAPSAAAEQVVFDFLLAVHAVGARSVVIAGNHDSGPRVGAWGRLARLAGVHAVGLPCKADEGGVIEITRGEETAVVACLPFASARSMASSLELLQPPAEGRALYARRMKQAMDALCASFRDDTINLLLAHTNVVGAAFGGSERMVHLTDSWSVLPQDLPRGAHYVALGHLHRPQWIEGAPSPARYAGSPLQMDFGEVDDDKTFTLIEAHPGQPATFEEVPYKGGKRLYDIQSTFPDLLAQASLLAEGCWLRTTVELSEHDPDIGRRVRERLPNALVVRARSPEVPYEPALPKEQSTAPERFRDYYHRVNERPPSEALMEAFTRLYEELAGDGHAEPVAPAGADAVGGLSEEVSALQATIDEHLSQGREPGEERA